MNKVHFLTRDISRYVLRGICLLFTTHMLLGLWPTYFRAYQDLLPSNFSWDFTLIGMSTIAFPAIVLLEFCYHLWKRLEMSPIVVDVIFVSIWLIVFWSIVVYGFFVYGPWSI